MICFSVAMLIVFLGVYTPNKVKVSQNIRLNTRNQLLSFIELWCILSYKLIFKLVFEIAVSRHAAVAVC